MLGTRLEDNMFGPGGDKLCPSHRVMHHGLLPEVGCEGPAVLAVANASKGKMGLADLAVQCAALALKAMAHGWFV